MPVQRDGIGPFIETHLIQTGEYRRLRPHTDDYGAVNVNSYRNKRLDAFSRTGTSMRPERACEIYAVSIAEIEELIGRKIRTTKDEVGEGC